VAPWFTGSCLASLAAVALALPAAQSPALEMAMRDKLSHTQQLLEAIVTADFPAVDRHAERLSRISYAEIGSWQANAQPDYVQQAVLFLSSVQGLREAAAKRNGDLALQEYTALVSSCVRCHMLPSVARVRLERPAPDRSH
jgi:hypothetical protein